MKITLFGSANGEIDKIYLKEGEKLGKEISKRNHTLIFGGGNEGMMGSVAKECIKNNTKVIGVIPEIFKESNTLYSKVIYTETMRERKLEMRQYTDGFIIVPGGIGTLDEFFEVLELLKQDLHNKPIAILNINNFYIEIINFIKKNIRGNFIPSTIFNKIKITEDIVEALDYLENNKEE